MSPHGRTWVFHAIPLYSDLTVDRLARKLQMSKSTLYKYFHSKDGLICAIVSQQRESLIAALTRVEEERLPQSPSRALLDVVEVFAEHAALIPRSVLLQGESLPEPCRGEIATLRRGAKDTVRAILEAGQERGEVAVASIPLAASVLVGAVEAATLAGARGDVDVPRDEAVRQAYRLLAPGLLGSLASAPHSGAAPASS